MHAFAEWNEAGGAWLDAIQQTQVVVVQGVPVGAQDQTGAAAAHTRAAPEEGGEGTQERKPYHRVKRLATEQTSARGKHSSTVGRTFLYQTGHHVSFKVVDEDATDEKGEACIQLMCCGDRRCQRRDGQGIGKGLLVPKSQWRNKKQNFLDPHVLHHLVGRPAAALTYAQRLAAHTRDLERAWIWRSALPPLRMASCVAEVEAWADRHLRSTSLEDAMNGTAIVVAANVAGLPPQLTWAAAMSEDLPADRREYAATDGLYDFLERQAGGSLKLHTPVAAQKPTVASLRTMLREGEHPAVEQPLPLITELPAPSKTDPQSARLRAAMLALLGGQDSMLPDAWLEDGRTVLGMLNDPARRAALFLLVMHSQCNLAVHVDALGTGAHPHPPLRQPRHGMRSTETDHGLGRRERTHTVRPSAH